LIRPEFVLVQGGLIEGSGSFPRKASIEAKWMIATGSPPQADLRPLGIVLNEQL